MYRVYINNEDLTDYVGEVSWSDSLETLATELSFKLATSRRDSNFKRVQDITLGATFQLLGRDGVVVEGIIVSEEVGELTTSFLVYDLAWYLNKSTVIKQFKKVTGKEAIERLCEELGIPVEIEGLGTLIDKIYKDKKVSDVIRDIIAQEEKHSKVNYYLAFEEGKLKIQPFKKVVVNGEFELSQGNFIDVNSNVGEVSLSRSIKDLKNSILVTSGDKEAIRVEGKAQDLASIEKYGKLQEVITLEEEQFGKANIVANNELKKLNRIAEDFNIKVLGDDKLKSGKVIELDIPLYRLKGDYLIKQSSHTVNGGIHTANLVLEAYYE